ncbi:MAG TPA: PepSY-associated TM helix domain-containing protein [Rhodopila sp.]|uniref:PepSY-associated TM helix domain-containing protein n=1 Tax=Rhodopila sp. TaxID=2480087 RepID=UPI002B5937D7|nr:PepSY-associated TM helix domain-containing protein [Rhodopila sp.]HVY15011.1 PepSY-associated TM helix domain-containing protein [Rhodopila sp.]
MSARSIRLWSVIHKWTSLLCTLFLLVICLTGLPLIFREEIGDWLNDDPPYAAMPPDTPMASLDGMAAQGLHRYPGQIVTSIFVDDDEPKVLVFMAPSWRAFIDDPRSRHWLKFDARTARLLHDSDPMSKGGPDFLTLMLRLHTDLFAGLPGSLFLGAMGCVFVAALVSGVVLYAPFMRRLPFGTVRARRSRRLRWLDLHNLLGVVAAAWMLTLGLTGVLNELTMPLFALWQNTDVRAMLHRWQGEAPPTGADLSSPDAAFRAVKAALPGMEVVSLVYPGSPFGTPFHYVLWAKGTTPLTSRLFSPVLVDARTGALTAVMRMPWYLRALELSRPLHFGDYGGMPLKIIWASLDIATIVVLGSGLYLWLKRGRIPMESQRPGNETISMQEAPVRTAAE